MKKSDLIYYLGFSYCLGIGPMTFQALKSHPKGVQLGKKIFNCLEMLIGEYFRGGHDN